MSSTSTSNQNDDQAALAYPDYIPLTDSDSAGPSPTPTTPPSPPANPLQASSPKRKRDDADDDGASTTSSKRTKKSSSTSSLPDFVSPVYQIPDHSPSPLPDYESPDYGRLPTVSPPLSPSPSPPSPSPTPDPERLVVVFFRWNPEPYIKQEEDEEEEEEVCLWRIPAWVEPVARLDPEEWVDEPLGVPVGPVVHPDEE